MAQLAHVPSIRHRRKLSHWILGIFSLVALIQRFDCRTASASSPPELRLPFPNGYRSQCTQGNGGATSHNLPSTRHALDLDDQPSTPGRWVLAAASGIARVRHNQASWGNNVRIDHGGGYFTLYAHLASVSIQDGESVQMGRQIGTIGTTGNSTGIHLHFALHEGNASAATIPASIPAPRIWARNVTHGGTFKWYSSQEFLGGIAIPPGAVYEAGDPPGSPPPPIPVQAGYEGNSTRHQGIIDCFIRGGGDAVVGLPASMHPYNDPYVHRYFGSGYKQDFSSGSRSGAILQEFFSSSDNPPSPAFWLYGGVWNRYKELGGAASFLGWPTADQVASGTSGSGTSGFTASFAGGDLVWPAQGPGATGEVHTLREKLRQTYRESGSASGPLGYPNTSNVTATSIYGTTGEYAGFEGGQVMWPRSGPGAASDAFAITGRILQTHRALDGLGGGLGYPNTPHVNATSLFGTSGQYVGFEGGQIMSPLSGPGAASQAFSVDQEILAYHRSRDGLSGSLGYPQGIPNQVVSAERQGQAQVFEGGTICVSSLGTFSIRKPILEGHDFVRFGFPRGEAYQRDGVLRQDFERGTIILGEPTVLTIESPQAPLIIGQFAKVKWKSRGIARDTLIRLELSRNGGSSWRSITSGTPNSGFYRWQVSGPSTAKARLRVSVLAQPAVVSVQRRNVKIARP